MNSNEKQEKIVGMFDEIASTYDLANRVLSFGIDVQWRKKGCAKAFDLLESDKIEQIVDVATGTGDLLLHWKSVAEKRDLNIGRYLGIDPSSGMLEVARKKVEFADFIQGKAQELPMKDESSEIVSIAYGIRNVVDREEALNEFYRVLKPGGILVILEFTRQDRSGLISSVVDLYMKRVLPIVGGLVSKNYAAYRYLPDSIEEFLTADMLIAEMSKARLQMCYVKSFSMGISTLFVAQKSKR